MANIRLTRCIRLFLVVTLFGAFQSSAAYGAVSSPILTTAQFVFYSDFATNLNQTLIADFVARRAGQPGVFDNGANKTCFDALPQRDRDGWARAQDYYRTNQSTTSQRVLLRLQLAGLVDRAGLKDPLDGALLDAFAVARSDATAAFRRCRWATEDASNRDWVKRLAPLLRAHSATLAGQLPRLFHTEWTGLPFRVDVVETATLGGNSAVSDSNQLHILVSSTNPDNRGLAALEVVFHEACHLLAQPGGPLSNALNAAGANAGVTLPPDILHQVHFFLTGDAVRRTYDRAGVAYTPDVYALHLFSDGYRGSVARIWRPYIDGSRTLDEAAAEMAAAFTP